MLEAEAWAGSGLVVSAVGVGVVPGGDGVGGGSDGVGEGLVGGYGSEDGVTILVGVGDGPVAADALVDVGVVEVLLDVGPGLWESGVPVGEEG